MSMAIKYAMAKKAKKAMDGEPCDAHGAEMCEMCHGGKMMAKGGEVEPEEDGDGDMDMIDRIMKKRKKMSEGGKISNDIEPVADSEKAQYDDMEKDDDLEMHDTGSNSGDDLGNVELDENDHDLISRIMRSRAKRDRMPRPA